VAALGSSAIRADPPKCEHEKRSHREEIANNRITGDPHLDGGASENDLVVRGGDDDLKREVDASVV
jgi:hypothetical protein